MTEYSINYSTAEQTRPPPSHVFQQRNQNKNSSNEQLDWTTKILADNPEAASYVYKYLQETLSSKIPSSEQNTSTPKRSRPLDDSGGSVNNGNGRRTHQRKRFQQGPEKITDQNDRQTSPLGSRQAVESSGRLPSNAANSTRNRISFDQLKHAVSSNLPCFHVKWPVDTDRKKIPSALKASELIVQELKANGVKINGFTLVGWAGKRLKLGVNNKADYATLSTTDKWPAVINGVNVEIIKPKFTPDAFVLVVRYVPQELEEDFVVNEIQRTIASANRIKRIQYSYKRKSNDYRFEVNDYAEYQSILKLGRIAIGYTWLSITPFYSGNRLTYCTKCWCIGHLRSNCNSASKCRICLELINDKSEHICTKEPKCAQCNGNHHSLDNKCRVIQEYKQRLKEEVEEAINSGRLRRIAPMEQAPVFKFNEKDFPALKSIEYSHTPKWSNAQESGDIKLAQLLDGMKRIEEKVDQIKIDMRVVNLDTQLLQAVLLDVIESLTEFTQKFIPLSLTYSKTERTALIPIVQQFSSRFYSTATKLMDGFKKNHTISDTVKQIQTLDDNDRFLGPPAITALLPPTTYNQNK